MCSALIMASLALPALALLGLAKWTSDLLLHGRRQALSRTPEDYGLDYENVAFPAKDGLQLKGWWLPSSPKRDNERRGPAPAVILLHPMFGNRQGITASRGMWPFGCLGSVDLLDVACCFHAAGYAVLLFDFRSHGESAPGICAGGYNEDQDVVGAVDYVFRRMAAQAPDGAAQVGVVGFGLGASAAVTAAGRERGDARTIRVFSADNEGATGIMEFRPANIKMLRFMVAVEPASLRTLLRVYLRRAFPPLAWLLVPLVNRFFGWGSGYPLDGALLIEFARHVHTPALYVHAGRDPRNGGEMQQIYEATPGPKQMWRIEERFDPLEVYDHVAKHLEGVLAFSDATLNMP